ncbi:hypothetical protein Pelo_11353 [Pelomyxa schiedti]|nr:hypothetical protein Pelo_11353 [Pelomyxa schiedti]
MAPRLPSTFRATTATASSLLWLCSLLLASISTVTSQDTCVTPTSVVLSSGSSLFSFYYNTSAATTTTEYTCTRDDVNSNATAVPTSGLFLRYYNNLTASSLLRVRVCAQGGSGQFTAPRVEVRQACGTGDCVAGAAVPDVEGDRFSIQPLCSCAAGRDDPVQWGTGVVNHTFLAWRWGSFSVLVQGLAGSAGGGQGPLGVALGDDAAAAGSLSSGVVCGTVQAVPFSPGGTCDTSQVVRAVPATVAAQTTNLAESSVSASCGDVVRGGQQGLWVRINGTAVAPTTRKLTVHSCNSGTRMNTVISVMTSSTASATPSSMCQESFTCVQQSRIPATSCASGNPAITWEASSDTQYAVYVTSLDPYRSGLVELDLIEGELQSNIECQSPTAIVFAEQETNSVVVDDTRKVVMTSSTCQDSVQTMWYELEAAEGMIYNFNIVSKTSDVSYPWVPTMELYTSCDAGRILLSVIPSSRSFRAGPFKLTVTRSPSSISEPTTGFSGCCSSVSSSQSSSSVSLSSSSRSSSSKSFSSSSDSFSSSSSISISFETPSSTVPSTESSPLTSSEAKSYTLLIAGIVTTCILLLVAGGVALVVVIVRYYRAHKYAKITTEGELVKDNTFSTDLDAGVATIN